MYRLLTRSYLALSMYMNRAILNPLPVQGHARIRSCPCTWTWSNMAMSMYKDGHEFGLVPIHGQGHIPIDVGVEGG